MYDVLASAERLIETTVSNLKMFEKIFSGMEGSYVELFTLLALGLLAFIPMVAPTARRQRWRFYNQMAGLVIFVLVVFTCMGVFGMIRNFFRGLSEIGRENIIALYFASVPVTILVTTLLFGPFFCGWICPTGALQEWIGGLTRRWHQSRKEQGYPFSRMLLFAAIGLALLFIGWVYRLSTTRVFFLEDATLYWTLILVLLLFLLAWQMQAWDSRLRRLRVISFSVVLIGTILGLRITSPVHFGFAKVYDPASILATVMVVLASLLIPRIWCRYLCPWREIIGWASRYSTRVVVLDKTKCTRCGICDRECEVDAVVQGRINNHECHMCLKCVDVCPEQALQLKDQWRKP